LEPAPALRPRYDEIAQSSGLFIDPSAGALRTNPLQQFFRQTCLAQAMLTQGDYDESRLVVVAPRLNHLIQNVIGAYRCQLVEPAPGKVSFGAVTLENVIEPLHRGARRPTPGLCIGATATSSWWMEKSSWLSPRPDRRSPTSTTWKSPRR
jgi:hypothetical protein